MCLNFICKFKTIFLIIKLDLLSGLVADYSDEHYSIGEPTLIDMLKLRMYEMGLNQLALSKLLGITPSRICEYLNGKKEGCVMECQRARDRLKEMP